MSRDTPAPIQNNHPLPAHLLGSKAFRLLAWFLRRDRGLTGLLALLCPWSSVPQAPNKSSSCDSWTSPVSGSVFLAAGSFSVSWPACSGLPLTAEGEGTLKTGHPRPLPFPLPAFSTPPLVAYLTCVSDERKIGWQSFDLTGYLYALSPSRYRYKHILQTFEDRFIRFSCVICSFYPVCVRYLYGSYATRTLLVLYTFGSRTVIVRFMRF